MAQQVRREQYSFTDQFTAALAFRLCSSPKLFSLLGKDIEAEMLPLASASLAVQAVQAVAKEVGHGADSPVVVIQRLRRWMHEGRVSTEQIAAVLDMLDGAEDVGLPSDETILAEAVPVLRRRIEHEAILAASEDYGARRDMDRAMRLMNRAHGLGVTEETRGVRLGGDSFRVIDQLRHLDRLPTGVLELDVRIGNGLARGQLGVLVGGAGDGKSMALSHITTFAAMSGLHVVYATLELPEAIVLARMKAAMTGLAIDVIMNDPEVARERLSKLNLGPTWVRFFTAQVTTVADMQNWMIQCEEGAQRPVDLLVVDYADKLTDPRRKQESSAYKTMELVYEALRLVAVERRCWVWTASQATRRHKDGRKMKLDLEHVADSAHKVRVADLVITLNVSEDGQEVELYVAKNRTGESRKGTPPLPTAFAYGVLTPTQMPQCGGEIAGAPLLAAETARILGGGAPF